MALKDIFSRGRRPLDGPSAGDGVSPVAGELSANNETLSRQKLIFYSICGIVLAFACFWIFGGSSSKTAATDTDKPNTVKVSAADMVSRDMSEQEWMARSENQLQSQDNQLKAAQGTDARVTQLAAEVDQLKTQNQTMTNDGQRVLAAYQSENETLRRQVNAKAAEPVAPPPSATAMYGPGSPYGAGPGAAGAGGAPMTPIGVKEVSMVSFSGADTGTASKVAKGNTVYTDSPNYLPPNSFATAKVIVGVDAATGVNSQTDPLPVVLRITGPARSVLQNGKLLTTRIEGCLVNGAARAELSSEKVYVKLQKMTCPQPGGRYAVSEVKGFIAFGGKTGVRGHVVSREGSLVSQAFIAGLVGGFGRGFAANAQAALNPASVVLANGKRQQLGVGEIAQGGFGEGISQTGDMVSKYLIERAEQYQPVVEMPTGVDVEIVFLEGTYVRN